MPIINTRVDAELAAKFHELAADRGTTASEVLRQAITAFVERDTAAKEPLTERTLMKALRPASADPQWPPRSGYGERLKKDKGSK